MSRNHRLKATKGKSDQTTLKRAKQRNAINVMLRIMKLPQLKDRDTRMAIANRIKANEIERSKGLPSSKAAADIDTPPASHWEGFRDPAINIEITGTHKAGETLGSLAGSKHSNATSKTN